jgi:hypothetical protein
MARMSGTVAQLIGAALGERLVSLRSTARRSAQRAREPANTP